VFLVACALQSWKVEVVEVASEGMRHGASHEQKLESNDAGAFYSFLFLELCTKVGLA